jgi:hypothetical protein
MFVSHGTVPGSPQIQLSLLLAQPEQQHKQQQQWHDDASDIRTRTTIKGPRFCLFCISFGATILQSLFMLDARKIETALMASC